MPKIPYSITSNDEFSGATVVVDGEIYTAGSDHPNYGEIVALLTSDTEDGEELVRLISPITEIDNKLIPLSERISARGGLIYFDGDAIENAFTDHIIRILNEEGTESEKKQAYDAYVKFLENLATNPSRKSRDHLTNYVEEHGVTLDKDGYMILYKGVNADGTSIHAGYGIVDGVEYQHANLPNHVGAVVEIPRSMVDDNRAVGCSTGLHVGTYAYADNFKGYRGILLTARVNPRDIVSVPSDSSNQKIRTARYTVLELTEAEHTGTTLYGEDEVDNDFEPDEDYVPVEDDSDSKTAFASGGGNSYIDFDDEDSDLLDEDEDEEPYNFDEVDVDENGYAIPRKEFSVEKTEQPDDKVEEFKKLIPSIIQGGWTKKLSVYKNKRITSGQREAFQQAIDELGLQ